MKHNKGPEATAQAYRDAGSRQGVRRPCRGRGGPGGQILLRPASPSLAAGDQREHQRAAARVLPEAEAPGQGARRGGQKGVR